MASNKEVQILVNTSTCTCKRCVCEPIRRLRAISGSDLVSVSRPAGAEPFSNPPDRLDCNREEHQLQRQQGALSSERHSLRHWNERRPAVQSACDHKGCCDSKEEREPKPRTRDGRFHDMHLPHSSRENGPF